MKAIIFGSNGQDGFYLSKLLIKLNIQVLDVSRTNASVIGDVSNYDFIERIIKESLPSYIFHFAAVSSTRHEALFENHSTICTGTLNILESVRKFSPKTKVFLSGSAMQFKNTGLPIDENTEFEASSPYSVARIHNIYAARYYREKFQIQVYCGYFFNHDSPLRTINHINQKIVKAVQSIQKGNIQKLFLGDIDVQKEFNHAMDLMEAVWVLVNQNIIHEVVLGSGIAHPIKSWVKYCFDTIEKNWEDYVEIDINYKREYDILVCNPSLIKSLGWQPKISFSQLANEMLNN